MAEDASRPLLIVAEDNAELRSLFVVGLEHVGFRVLQASTGAGLVDEVRRVIDRGEHGGRVALIITDIRMPELDGMSALRTLREHGFATPIIVITAFVDATTRSDAERLGVTLLAKPIGLIALRAAVNEALGIRSA